MADNAELKLTLRLVPVDGQLADPVVLNDIILLIRQAVATAPKDAPKIAEPTHGFRLTRQEEKPALQALESRIENRIQETSAKSRAAVEKRELTANQSDAKQQLAEDSLAAAANVVSAVQGALFRRVALRAVENDI